VLMLDIGLGKGSLMTRNQSRGLSMRALPRRQRPDPLAPLSSRTALPPATCLLEYVPKSFSSHTQRK
jgi:hypothetical protein